MVCYVPPLASVPGVKLARTWARGCYSSHMAKALMVTSKGSKGTWDVHLMDVGPREETGPVEGVGPVVDSVSSWPGLDNVAKRYPESQDIYGDGLDEMEGELGSRPE